MSLFVGRISLIILEFKRLERHSDVYANWFFFLFSMQEILSVSRNDYVQLNPPLSPPRYSNITEQFQRVEPSLWWNLFRAADFRSNLESFASLPASNHRQFCRIYVCGRRRPIFLDWPAPPRALWSSSLLCLTIYLHIHLGFRSSPARDSRICPIYEQSRPVVCVFLIDKYRHAMPFLDPRFSTCESRESSRYYTGINIFFVMTL